MGKLKTCYFQEALRALTLLILITAIALMPIHTYAATAVTIKTQAAADSVRGAKGIDVSKYQGSINWERVAQDGVSYVMARASIGVETDETFLRNATGAHANGIMVGAYHYAKFTSYATMQDELRVFLSQLSQVNITYPVALDVEAHRNLSKSELTRLTVLFVEEVKAAGYDVMIYSYNNFFNAYFDMSALSGYKLWVAHYGSEPAMGQSIWQYSNKGSVWGINGDVDMNVAYEELGRSQKVITVNKDISNSIKETLNARYNAGLPIEGLDMDVMNRAVAQGLQREVNLQFGIDLPIYESVSESSIMCLTSIDYVKGRTKGNITYLLQVKLFYKGCYEGYPTGEYDEATAQAVARYQREYGIHPDGALNSETVDMLARA